MSDFDLLVLGAGSGGVRAARRAAASGARVAVVEHGPLGGTCVNIGCVPKKLFVFAAHVHEEIINAQGFGWDLQVNNFSWSTLISNKNKEILRLNNIYQKILHDANVTILHGEGSFIDKNTLQVGDQQYTADNILIATGAKPFVPQISGSEHIIVSDEAFYLQSLPESMIIVGGGYIAVEFAGIFAGLGVDVTLLLRGEKILRGFDEDIRDHVQQEMIKKGIKIKTCSQITAIEKNADKYSATLCDGEILNTGLIFMATGRVPLTESLNVQAAGVKLDHVGAVCIDDYFKTNVDNIYALGDVTHRIQLTPVAIKEAEAFVQNIFYDNPVKVDYDNIATAVFCQPNIGTVGLTEEQATANYENIQIYRSEFRPMRYVLGSITERSFMKLIVDKETDKVIGLHVVGPDAGEIVQGFAVAIKAGATKAMFDATVGIHPTSAEELVTMR